MRLYKRDILNLPSGTIVYYSNGCVSGHYVLINKIYNSNRLGRKILDRNLYRLSLYQSIIFCSNTNLSNKIRLTQEMVDGILFKLDLEKLYNYILVEEL